MRLTLVWVLSACGGAAPSAPKLPHGTQRVSVQGHQVAIDIRGTGPVCIVHPGGPGLDSTYLHLPALEQRFTLVYIDPLGTGASDALPADDLYSVAHDAAAIEAVRVKLGLERVCLVGHSYGGIVVQQYAVDHPRNVSGLLLYSTTPTTEPVWERAVADNMQWFKDQPWFADAAKAFEDEAKAKDEAELAADVKRELPMYFADWTGHREQYAGLANQFRIAFDPYKRRVRGKPARFDVRRKLGLLGMTPAVVIAGERDFICGVGPSTWIADSIPDSKLIVIPRAGHFAHVEQPAEFEAAVETFAAKLR